MSFIVIMEYPTLTKENHISFTLGFPEHNQQFHISKEALINLGGGSNVTDINLLAAFKDQADRIIQTAEQKYGQPSSEIILLKSTDFF